MLQLSFILFTHANSWCHFHPIISCFIKIQNGLPFWCRLTQVVLEIRPLNRCISVVVVQYNVTTLFTTLSNLFFVFSRLRLGDLHRWNHDWANSYQYIKYIHCTFYVLPCISFSFADAVHFLNSIVTCENKLEGDNKLTVMYVFVSCMSVVLPACFHCW